MTEWQPDWEHAANEWADVAVNGLQWLKNVREGISTTDTAIENMNLGLEHCRETVDKVRSKPTMRPVPEPVGYFNPNMAQYLDEVGEWIPVFVSKSGKATQPVYTSQIPSALLPQIVESLELCLDMMETEAMCGGRYGSKDIFKLTELIAALKQLEVK